MPQALISLSGVNKSFGKLRALEDASIALQAGEVTAIVGENGAGKSTLAKIIAGILPMDAGAFNLDGVAVTNWSRRRAIEAGIGFVPQSLSFLKSLSITENHLLAKAGLRLDRKTTRAELAEAARLMDMSPDFDEPVGRLSLAERQMGEIIAALADGARVLLLDEPTSALGPLEIDRLVAAIRRLAASGTSIGLVTHRITEVLRGADRITVLRAGKVVLDGDVGGLAGEDIARLMVGDRDRSAKEKTTSGSTWTRLQVSDLCVGEGDAGMLDDVSFSVKQGEILAIAGVAGASQPALAEALSGLRSMRGSVLVDGVDVSGDAARAAEAGLAFIPENRADGVAGDLTIAENASLFAMAGKAFQRFGARRRAAERARGVEIIEAFDVRPPNPEARASGLSGGNQQKLLVGRELAQKPGVIVAHGPTQGLDLAASATIRGALTQAAADGAAVVVLSADLDELLEIGHRLVVLTHGRLVAKFDLSGPVDMTAIGRAMAGLPAQETPA
ncbi:ATP-binding cassette domain-containing protein [Rhizobium sp. FKL33]|uniref:ATP-binding cassette domain-containing protein n=1 Tax=Rhizobium sp. FKL33 TaxID=2562307 RepID=UPI0010BFEB62|nr:ATP-binding cassette domain-containing protein [Rhizobium sp. FKL33]